MVGAAGDFSKVQSLIPGVKSAQPQCCPGKILKRGQVFNMHVLLIKLRLKIPYAHSLKDKRRQIKSLKDRLSSRFNASVAEIDALDNWQQAVMGVCMISNDKTYLDKQYSLVEALVLEYTELELIDVTREWL